MINITNSEILHKIIEIQSCIIQGKNLKVLLHKNRDFYLNKTKADIITICMNEHDMVKPDYILEKHRLFAHLLHKYVFENRTLAWDKFVQRYYYALISGKKFFQTSDLYDIFKGLLTKKETKAFNEELQMKSAFLMPLFDFNKNETIGLVCFLFRTDKPVDIDKLHEVQTLLQTLLQPLYDKQYSIVYNKLVRVDENFSLLTEQEKRITKKVLMGMPYAEISKSLNISINTLKTHMKNIFSKYNVKSKIALYNKLNKHE